jgi:pyridoxamine 5'-phosphate oxidase
MSERWIPLDVADCDESPFVQFECWFDEAKDEMREREAITLVTATPEGRPSARMVLLRHHGDGTFGWFTNYASRKGEELAANPFAALLWYCEPLGRQIRIEGAVTRLDAAASDAYFASRPRGHQLGAWASSQSTWLESRAAFDERLAEVTAEFEGREVPRPDYWGGYALTPDRFEFWQHRQNRCHDRVIYLPEGEGWSRGRQNP